jgi:hypothetical protein
VHHGGRRGPRRLVAKSAKFSNGRIMLQNDLKIYKKSFSVMLERTQSPDVTSSVLGPKHKQLLRGGGEEKRPVGSSAAFFQKKKKKPVRPYNKAHLSGKCILKYSSLAFLNSRGLFLEEKNMKPVLEFTHYNLSGKTITASCLVNFLFLLQLSMVVSDQTY